ncbi:MAG: transporter substrate-binding domain-containing protein [Oscillospiraceae bacterium]|jgi:ABC-type amino acid transport substrate-binding protein|nr:transporter substrate-binding domain-containing protein [Oscillospiraceae bacterium]
MKRILIAVLVLAMSLALASCGDPTTPSASPSDSAPAESASPSDSASASVAWFVLPEALATEEYAIGFRKEDEALTRLVNETLVELKNDGTLAKISTDWFGKDITTIPAEKPVYEAPTAEADDSASRTVLILGLDASFPPMGYDDNGTIVGFDIDVAKALCAKLGWELKLQAIDWNAKELELNSGNIDCIWNGMTKTDERDASMSLSVPYMNNEQIIVTREDSGIKTLADLAGKKLIMQTGSSAVDALESKPDFKATLGSTNTIDDNMTAFMDVEQGASDAILIDSIVANWYISR